MYVETLTVHVCDCIQFQSTGLDFFPFEEMIHALLENALLLWLNVAILK